MESTYWREEGCKRTILNMVNTAVFGTPPTLSEDEIEERLTGERWTPGLICGVTRRLIGDCLAQLEAASTPWATRMAIDVCEIFGPQWIADQLRRRYAIVLSPLNEDTLFSIERLRRTPRQRELLHGIFLLQEVRNWAMGRIESARQMACAPEKDAVH